MEAKTCKQCGIAHPKNDQFFYTTAVSKKDGRRLRCLRPECKACSVANTIKARHALGDANRKLRLAMGGDKACRRWMEETLGYCAGELVWHLERQFLRDMSLEKFFLGLIHIDHIVPIRCFDKSSKAAMLECYALPNLQPMWASENLAKSGKQEFLL